MSHMSPFESIGVAAFFIALLAICLTPIFWVTWNHGFRFLLNEDKISFFKSFVCMSGFSSFYIFLRLVRVFLGGL